MTIHRVVAPCVVRERCATVSRRGWTRHGQRRRGAGDGALARCARAHLRNGARKQRRVIRRRFAHRFAAPTLALARRATRGHGRDRAVRPPRPRRRRRPRPEGGGDRHVEEMLSRVHKGHACCAHRRRRLANRGGRSCDSRVLENSDRSATRAAARASTRGIVECDASPGRRRRLVWRARAPPQRAMPIRSTWPNGPAGRRAGRAAARRPRQSDHARRRWCGALGARARRRVLRP